MKMLRCVVLTMILVSFGSVCYAAPLEDLVGACKQGDLAKAQAALAAGANVNDVDSAGNPPLFYAIFWPEITKLLLDKGADPNVGNYPALVGAANGYSVEVMKLLLAKGADPNKPAVTIADPAAVFKKLAADEKAKGKNANAATLAMYENMVKAMPPPTKTSNSAIRMVVQQTNCVQCLDLLLKAGAKADEKDQLDENNPSYVGNPLFVLAAFSMTAADRAAQFKSGVAVIETTYGVKTPEWYGNLQSDRNGSPEDMLKLLVNAGLKVNETNKRGHTPLTSSLAGKKPFLAKALISQGADPKITAKVKFPKSTVEYIPTCQAAEVGDLELMTMIIEKGGDINANGTSAALTISSDSWGGDGYTPLIISLMADKLDIANYLLDKGADIAVGSNGYAIMTVKGFDKLKCMVVLEKKTPIYWAIDNGDMALINKIGEKMVWKYNSSFKIKVRGTVENQQDIAGTWSCKFTSDSSRPSTYANEIGRKEASTALMSKGL